MNETLLPTSPPPEPGRWVNADALDRANRAWTARVAGGTWAQAAEVAGYGSPEAAIKGVRNVYGEVPKVLRDDLRHLWRDRIEMVWRQAVKDVIEQRPGAVTAAVRVMQAAAVLDGLNEPVRMDVDLSVAEAFEQITMELVSNGL